MNVALQASSSPGPVTVPIAAWVAQCAATTGCWSFSLLAPELAGATGLDERDFGMAVTFIFLGAFCSSPSTGSLVGCFGGMGIPWYWCPQRWGWRCW